MPLHWSLVFLKHIPFLPSPRRRVESGGMYSRARKIGIGLIELRTKGLDINTSASINPDFAVLRRTSQYHQNHETPRGKSPKSPALFQLERKEKKGLDPSTGPTVAIRRRYTLHVTIHKAIRTRRLKRQESAKLNGSRFASSRPRNGGRKE